MKKSFWLIFSGGLIALFAALNQHLSYVLILPLVILGVICLCVGYANSRSEREPTAPNAKKRRRDYLILSLAVIIGVSLGFIIYGRVYPDVPISIRLLVSSISLVLAAGFFCWDILFRQRTVR